MFGYRARRHYQGVNLTKFLNLLIFFLLIGVMVLVGIPAALMSNHSAKSAAVISNSHRQSTQWLSIKPHRRLGTTYDTNSNSDTVTGISRTAGIRNHGNAVEYQGRSGETVTE